MLLRPRHHVECLVSRSRRPFPIVHDGIIAPTRTIWTLTGLLARQLPVDIANHQLLRGLLDLRRLCRFEGTCLLRLHQAQDDQPVAYPLDSHLRLGALSATSPLRHLLALLCLILLPTAASAVRQACPVLPLQV